MESILAVAFGSQTELHSSQGPEDPLLKSARTLFDAQRPDSGAPDTFTIVALKCKKSYLLACITLPTCNIGIMHIRSHYASIHIVKKVNYASWCCAQSKLERNGATIFIRCQN